MKKKRFLCFILLIQKDLCQISVFMLEHGGGFVNRGQKEVQSERELKSKAYGLHLAFWLSHRGDHFFNETIVPSSADLFYQMSLHY